MTARNKKQDMNERLRNARLAAGFVSATDAIEYCKWKGSTYRAHENGQNNFNVEYATRYGKAYGVSASWLLLGEGSEEGAVAKRQPSKNRMKGCTLKNCPDRIQAYSLLLKDEPENITYIGKLRDCCENYIELIKRKK
jgi:hypothetical protein